MGSDSAVMKILELLDRIFTISMPTTITPKGQRWNNLSNKMNNSHLTHHMYLQNNHIVLSFQFLSEANNYI